MSDLVSILEGFFVRMVQELLGGFEKGWDKLGGMARSGVCLLKAAIKGVTLFQAFDLNHGLRGVAKLQPGVRRCDGW